MAKFLNAPDFSSPHEVQLGFFATAPRLRNVWPKLNQIASRENSHSQLGLMARGGYAFERISASRRRGSVRFAVFPKRFCSTSRPTRWHSTRSSLSLGRYSCGLVPATKQTQGQQPCHQSTLRTCRRLSRYNGKISTDGNST